MDGQERPKVFISYSHDSEEHKERVRALMSSLERDGCECSLDVYKETGEDWPTWMTRQCTGSDFILCVITETYARRFADEEPPNVGLGVGWEAGLIRRLLYAKKLHNDTIFPVCFDKDQTAHIPIALQGYDYFVLDDPQNYDNLLRKILHAPRYERPERGERPRLPSTKTPPLFGKPGDPPPPIAKVPDPRLLVALVDKVPQWQAIERQAQLKARPRPPSRSAYAFVIAGADQEWPRAIKFKLCESVNRHNPAALKPLKPDYAAGAIDDALWRVLADEFRCEATKKSIEQYLADRPCPELFWLRPPSGNPEDHRYLAELMVAWESLDLSDASSDHFLLVIHDPASYHRVFNRLIPSALKRDPLDRWIKRMQDALRKFQLEQRVLAKPTSPTLAQVRDWIDDHLTYLDLHKDDVHSEAMRLFKSRSSIPHLELRDHLIKVLEGSTKT